jgi:hypothetical protein
MPAKRLDFLVIGAQKCATSWLYYCLRDHPELHLSAKKREREYLGGDLYEKRGADWYFALLEGAQDEQKLGAVSVNYMIDPRSPKVVHYYAPGVKLIASLRHPIERAISAYYYTVRMGLIPNLSLEEGLSIAVDIYNSQGEAGPAKVYYQELIKRGEYSALLENYLRYFSPKQLLLVTYDDIEERPLSVLQKIYEFIGVSASYVPERLGVKPKYNTYLRPLIYLEHVAPKSQAIAKLLDLSNQYIHKLGIGRKKPVLSCELTDKLNTIYRPQIERLDHIVQQLPASQRPLSQDLVKLWSQV